MFSQLSVNLFTGEGRGTVTPPTAACPLVWLPAGGTHPAGMRSCTVGNVVAAR